MIDDRPSALPPQIAIRVAYLGIAAFIILGVIFFRLWYLQVLAGDHNVAQARANRVRVEKIPAPRGDIVDRGGQPIVANRPATVVSLNPRSLPTQYRDAILEWGRAEGVRLAAVERKKPGARKRALPRPQPPAKMADLYGRIGRVLQISRASINRKVVDSIVQVPYGNVQIEMDINDAERDYIREHHELFPDVDVRQRYLRKYPHGGLAAQVIGIIGEVSPEQLKQRRFRGVEAGAIVGKEGLEYSYDRFLRGTDGEFSIVVDADGDRQGIRTSRDPRIGQTLQLTMDLGLQQQAQEDFADVAKGRAGAFVAMNPVSGDIYAMGSFPTYDPRIFSRPLSRAQLNAYFGRNAGTPRFNRAISAGYPTASTFKPVTALAALDENRIDADTPIVDTGCKQIGLHKDQKKCNAGNQALGTLTLRKAIQLSSNVFFTDLAIRLDQLAPREPLQRWARNLGYGRATGVDLPLDAKGLVPDADWRDEVNKAESRCRKKKGRPCGLADGFNRPWQTGDEANLALGQGDLLASPMQVAVAYSAIANGGTIVRPHLGAQINDADGRLVQQIDPGARRSIKIDTTARDVVMDGLHLATVAGTSADVFTGWPHDRFPLYGKTGTAERRGQGNQSWYAVYAQDKDNPIVIVVTIERGGFGAEAAAPVACRMLAKWFHIGDGPQCKPGESRSL